MSDGEIITNKLPGEVHKTQINRRTYRSLIHSKRRGGKATQYHLSREDVTAACKAKGIIK